MKSIDKINMILLQKGMSGAELSIKAGLSNSAYSQWNTEKNKTDKKTLAKVAAALDVDITEIMDDDDLQTPYAYHAMQKAKAELAKEKQKSPSWPQWSHGLLLFQHVGLPWMLPTIVPFAHILCFCDNGILKLCRSIHSLENSFSAGNADHTAKAIFHFLSYGLPALSQSFHSFPSQHR